MSRNGAPLQLQKKIASFSRARLHKACGVCLHSMICHGFSLAEYSSHRNFTEKNLVPRISELLRVSENPKWSYFAPAKGAFGL